MRGREKWIARYGELLPLQKKMEETVLRHPLTNRKMVMAR